jgi:hypothetical protein
MPLGEARDGHCAGFRQDIGDPGSFTHRRLRLSLPKSGSPQTGPDQPTGAEAGLRLAQGPYSRRLPTYPYSKLNRTSWGETLAVTCVNVPWYELERTASCVGFY